MSSPPPFRHTKWKFRNVHGILRKSGRTVNRVYRKVFVIREGRLRRRIWWRRRESNPSSTFQYYEITMNFSRESFPDSIWIVSRILFIVPNSHGNINPGTGASDLHSIPLSGCGPSVDFFLKCCFCIFVLQCNLSTRNR